MAKQQSEYSCLVFLIISYSLDTGSPFLVNVGGNPSGRIRETVTKEMETAEAVLPGTQAEFILKIPGNTFTCLQQVTLIHYLVSANR